MRAFPVLLSCAVMTVAGIAQSRPPKPDRLRCKSVTPRPSLDFEFRFLAGHWFRLPMKQFWDRVVDLTVEMDVEPVNGTPGQPRSVSQRLQASQPVPQGISGELTFSSAVSLGIGEYRSRWRIRDSAGRLCEGVREFKAQLSSKEHAIEVALQPGEIVDTAIHLFRDAEPTERPHLNSPQRLKIFVNLDVLGRRGRVVRTRLMHILPHIAALRQLGRSQSFNRFSVVVFSFEDRRIIVRQDYLPKIDFAPLSRMIQELQPDTVNFRDLARGGEVDFLEGLLAQELRLTEIPDGVVFVGHEMHFGKRLSPGVLDDYRSRDMPVVFLDGSQYAWTGPIGHFVRAMDGREFVLRTPSDLAKAIAAFEARVRASRPQ